MSRSAAERLLVKAGMDALVAFPNSRGAKGRANVPS